MQSRPFVVIAALLVAACGGASSNEFGNAGAAGVSTAGGAAGMSAGGSPSTVGGGAASTSIGGGPGTVSGGSAAMSIGGSSTVSGAAGASAAGAPASGGASSVGGASSAGGASSGTLFISQFINLDACVARALPVDMDTASPTFGQLTCLVIETTDAAGCDCSEPGRAALSSALATAVRRQVMTAGECGASGQPACDSFCACEISQEVGAAGTKCKADPVAAASDPDVPPGFCYDNDPTSPALASCQVGHQEKVLFVSPAADPTPASGSSVFLACPATSNPTP